MRRFWKFLVIFLLELGILIPLSVCQTTSVTPKNNNASWWSTWENSGPLCETGQGGDSLGQHMGCSCNSSKPPKEEVDWMLTAVCSNQWLGYNDTLTLPPYLNISNRVRVLDLSRNHLTSLTLTTLGKCESVETLSVAENQLVTFDGVNCSRLLKLDLSRNRLKNLTAEALKWTPRLVELDLSFNELLFLDPASFEQLKNLRRLNLASNQLGKEVFYSEDYTLSLRNLKSLEELDLSNTTMPDFPQYLINGTTHLKKLILKNNLIQFITSGVVEQMRDLRVLDLSGNLLEEIGPNQFLGMRNLQILVLDKMIQLTAIRAHAFSGLKHLVELSCQMNYHLTSIDSLAFRGDPALFPDDPDPELAAHSLDSTPKIVRLNDNDLHSMDYSLLPWKSLDILELHRNSWICDCNLQWVSDFYRHRPKEARILEDSYFNCYEPHIFAGVSVVNVNPEEMLCFSPAATVAGAIGIVIFGLVLLSFCFVIILNQMGMLPDWVRHYNIFGSGSNLPAYMRVNPRPNTKARRMVERVHAIPELHCYTSPSTLDTGDGPAGDLKSTNNNASATSGGVGGAILHKFPLRGGRHHGTTGGSTEPIMDELEWDTADVGRP